LYLCNLSFSNIQLPLLQEDLLGQQADDDVRFIFAKQAKVDSFDISFCADATYRCLVF